MIRFTRANSKLKKLEEKISKRVDKFDLLAGHTCPFARDCRSSVIAGKVVDGPDTEFRCYAASLEALYENTFNLHNENTIQIKALRTKVKIKEGLQAVLPKKADVVRIHSSGDFYSMACFDAWLELARDNPEKTFYAYTKAVSLWAKRLGKIPDNMILTASYGGKHDHLIEKHGLRYVKVVYSKQAALDLNLEIDKDDFSAYNPGAKSENFALLIHGTQPKGSAAGKALSLFNLEERKR